MTSPAEEWRRIIRSGMPNAPRDDDELHRYLLAAYTGSQGIERFVMAVARLTFGDLDVAEDVLTYLPEPGHPARVLARSLDALLPTEATVLEDPAAARRWLAKHRDTLRWDPTSGRFESSYSD